jgi:hypothetical protein
VFVINSQLRCIPTNHFLFGLFFGLLMMLPLTVHAQSDTVKNAIQTALYEAEITRVAVQQQMNERLTRQRNRIEELSRQVAVAENARGEMAVEAVEAREQLRIAQREFTDALAARDRGYEQQLSIFRESLERITSTPEGLRALEVYNAGDRLRGRAIFLELLEARDAARQAVSTMERAADLRDLASLEQDMMLRGEIATSEVVARYEQIVRLDPGVSFDWVSLSLLYITSGNLEKAANGEYPRLCV